MNCSIISLCLLRGPQVVDLRIFVVILINHFVVGGRFVSYLIQLLTDRHYGRRLEFFHAVHIHDLVGIGRTGLILSPVMSGPSARFWSCIRSLRFWRLWRLDCLLWIL